MSRTPTVKFTLAPLKLEIDVLSHILNSDWAKYVTRKHPELKPGIHIKDEKTRVKFVAEYVKKFHKENQKEILSSVSRMQQQWDIKASRILDALQTIIGTNWPSNHRKIKAFVSINPVCPRFIQTWSFSINYGSTPASRVKQIVAHEIAHFLHFKKWKELFPNAKPETFETPHSPWLISELAAVAVLNDAQINKSIGVKEKPYAEHRALMVEGRRLITVINRLYRSSPDYGSFLRACAKLPPVTQKI